MPSYHRFPIDINTSESKYRGMIKFKVIGEVPPNYTFFNTEASRSTDNPSSAGLTFNDISLASSQNKAPVEYEKGEGCILYLPPSVQVTDGVNLENVELGVFGQGLYNALSSGVPGAAALQSAISDVTSSISDVFTGSGNTEIARLAATRAAGGFGSAFSGAVTSALQTAPNPFTRVIFRSVNLREFSFDFKMIPRSAKEAQEIKKIVHFFRRNLYPQTIKAGGFPVGYRFPYKFKIFMEYGEGNQISKDLSFLPMYLRSFSANYNPTSMSFHKDGNFSEVNITMAFIESRALTFDDVSEVDYTNDILPEIGAILDTL